MSTGRSRRPRRILVTGMSGAGKSTVLGLLAGRGHHVVDLDDAGWSHEQPGANGSVEQVWDEEKVAALLTDPTVGPVVLAGCAGNQGRFYDRLDAVLLLDVPRDVMLERLALRTTNEFGKDPVERARVLADAEAVLPLLRATSTRVIDATAPVEEVADQVEDCLLG